MSEDEMSRLREAEARVNRIYRRIGGILGAECRDSLELQVAVDALKVALEFESEALERVLSKRIPSIEATERLSRIADRMVDEND